MPSTEAGRSLSQTIAKTIATRGFRKSYVTRTLIVGVRTEAAATSGRVTAASQWSGRCRSFEGSSKLHGHLCRDPARGTRQHQDAGSGAARGCSVGFGQLHPGDPKGHGTPCTGRHLPPEGPGQEQVQRRREWGTLGTLGALLGRQATTQERTTM